MTTNRFLWFFAMLGASLAFAAEPVREFSPLSQSNVVPGGTSGVPHITFEGHEYRLAYADVKGQTVTNEYLIDGESLSAWKTLIGVRHFRESKEVKDVLPPYLKQMQPHFAIKAEVVQKKDSSFPMDVALIMWLIAPDKSYYEYNLHRFVQTPNGVMAYQFAERLPFSARLDVSATMKMQSARLAELFGLSAVTYESVESAAR